jgi:hypothetical protein
MIYNLPTREQFIDALIMAGNKYDGHVTEGSLQEQMKVIDGVIEHFVKMANEFKYQICS